jgi:hypothetical protein
MDVGHEVHVALPEQGHPARDQPLVQKRAVAVYANERLEAEPLGRRQQATRHVIDGAPGAVDAQLGAEALHRVVPGLVRGGDGDDIEPLRAGEPLEQVRQRRAAGERQQHLPRQARGAHPSLNQGSDPHPVSSPGD